MIRKSLSLSILEKEATAHNSRKSSIKAKFLFNQLNIKFVQYLKFHYY